MKKKLLIIILFLVSFSLVSAHSPNYDIDERHTYKEKITETKYSPDEHFTWSRTTYIDYDNNERFPTYDYRYGYTYRATTDYLNKHNPKKDISKNYERYFSMNSKDHKDYYSNSVLPLNYKKQKCYYTAPKDKLFYIQC